MLATARKQLIALFMGARPVTHYRMPCAGASCFLDGGSMTFIVFEIIGRCGANYGLDYTITNEELGVGALGLYESYRHSADTPNALLVALEMAKSLKLSLEKRGLGFDRPELALEFFMHLFDYRYQRLYPHALVQERERPLLTQHALFPRPRVLAS